MTASATWLAAKVPPDAMRPSGNNWRVGRSEVFICRTCFELWEPDGQSCSCRGDRSAPRWSGYDFNEHTHLCECCAGDALRSGSRWSVWFCEPCRLAITTVNALLGVPLIPIGRHTMMHGVALSTSDAADRSKVDQLLAASGDLFARMAHLHAWQRALIADRLRILHFEGDVALDDYLDEIRATYKLDGRGDGRLNRSQAVLRLLGHFGLAVTGGAGASERSGDHRSANSEPGS